MHGDIPTPVFMPVATGGAMRGVTLEDLPVLGADVLLCNTYHLHLRPGEQTVAEAGGLHHFIGWDKPILTDSGGFQVFSLKDIREITDAGVKFSSHLDGSPLFLGPEEAITIQWKLGSDIIMCFDECPPSTAPRAAQVAAVDRTLRWAKECKRVHEEMKRRSSANTSTPSFPSKPSQRSAPSFPLLFGIVQGGLERDLREKCAQELIAIGFDGYAVGGLAVGETEDEMMSILDAVCPILPTDKPRYLMGVGRLHQIREAVAKGIDMFDCVLQMREARHGTIYLSNGTKIRIVNAEFSKDHSPIDLHSPAPTSRFHTKAYLNHLLRSNERYGETLACLQNLAVTFDVMKNLRKS
jgi:queuine tRNA-ribosyltransferase